MRGFGEDAIAVDLDWYEYDAFKGQRDEDNETR
jgi:hypothetical protein